MWVKVHQILPAIFPDQPIGFGHLQNGSYLGGGGKLAQWGFDPPACIKAVSGYI
jgi:hypothetical protein